MGALVERAEHKIELLAEGYDALRQEIGDMREQLTDVQERVTRIEGQVAAIRDMGAKNSQDIVIMRVDIETIKSDIAIIRRDLKDKAGREELAVLESRVAELERTVRSE
jgi:chromosome segregation ATPase